MLRSCLPLPSIWLSSLYRSDVDVPPLRPLHASNLFPVSSAAADRMSKFGKGRETIWSRRRVLEWLAPSQKQTHSADYTDRSSLLLLLCCSGGKGKRTRKCCAGNRHNCCCQMGLSGFIAYTKPQNHLAYELFAFLLCAFLRHSSLAFPFLCLSGTQRSRRRSQKIIWWSFIIISRR